MPPDPPRFGMLCMPDRVLRTQLSCSLQCICAPPFCESWIRPCKIDVENQFEEKLKIKSLLAWSISEGRVDQKQIINFVQPKSMDEMFCRAKGHVTKFNLTRVICIASKM